jgi:hypothetical protein
MMEKLRLVFGENSLYYGTHRQGETNELSRDAMRSMIEARIILVLIGPQWASQENLARMHEPQGEIDLVRRWVVIALNRHAPDDFEAPILIPVLLDGATMPDKRELPKDIRALVKIEPIRLAQDEAEWPGQLAALAQRIHDALNPAPVRQPSLFKRLFSIEGAVGRLTSLLRVDGR